MSGHGRPYGCRALVGLLIATLVALATAEARAAVTSNSAAAIVAYPYLEADSSRGLDTFVQLTNTTTSAVNVLCFYEDTTAHCTGTTQACRSAADCSAGVTCDPGWVPWQFQIQLVTRQPVGWRVSQGGSSPFSVGSVPAAPEDPFVGALRCIVIDQSGAAVASNALIGHATIEQKPTDTTANFDVTKYNAIGLLAETGDTNGDGQLLLGGDAPEYQGCANVLILDHFFDQATEPVLRTSSVQTMLALLPCSADYVNGIPGQSTVSFSVTNELGTTTAGDQSFAVTGQLLATLDSPALQVGTQGTLTGTTRLQATGAGVVATAFEVHRNLANAVDQKSAARTVPGVGLRSAPDVIVIESPAPPVPTATPTPTGTAATATSTMAPTFTATSAPSATSTPITCTGDCDGQGSVTVDEILTMVNIALGNADVSACRAGNVSHDGQITVDEILTAVNNALNGCSSTG